MKLAVKLEAGKKRVEFRLAQVSGSVRTSIAECERNVVGKQRLVPLRLDCLQ